MKKRSQAWRPGRYRPEACEGATPHPDSQPPVMRVGNPDDDATIARLPGTEQE